MYYDRFFPFYVAYANPALYDGERIQEQEFALMKSYYPEAAGRIQEKWRKNASFWITKEADFMTNIRINLCCISCAGRSARR